MSLNLVNLDSVTRSLMLDEIDNDTKSTKLYISPRLNVIGQQEYPRLLKEAAEKHDDSWLASQLRNKCNFFNASETRNLKSGPISAKVPSNAPEMQKENSIVFTSVVFVFVQSKTKY
ncbi:MAG: hypothetical protein ABSC11_11885 [Smithella sp.]